MEESFQDDLMHSEDIVPEDLAAIDSLGDLRDFISTAEINLESESFDRVSYASDLTEACIETIYSENTEGLKLILDKLEDLREIDPGLIEETQVVLDECLKVAVLNDSPESVELLLREGADPYNTFTYEGQTSNEVAPLSSIILAGRYGSHDVIDVFLRLSNESLSPPEEGGSWEENLYLRVHGLFKTNEENSSFASEIIRRGFSSKLIDAFKNSDNVPAQLDDQLLIAGVRANDLRLVKNLLGGENNLSDDAKSTGLYIASRYKRSSCATSIIEAGGDVNYITEEGRLLVHYAIGSRCEATLNVLLDAAAPLNINIPGHHAVLYAARSGKIKIFEGLLKRMGVKGEIKVQEEVRDQILDAYLDGSVYSEVILERILNLSGKPSPEFLIKSASKAIRSNTVSSDANLNSIDNQAATLNINLYDSPQIFHDLCAANKTFLLQKKEEKEIFNFQNLTQDKVVDAYVASIGNKAFSSMQFLLARFPDISSKNHREKILSTLVKNFNPGSFRINVRSNEDINLLRGMLPTMRYDREKGEIDRSSVIKEYLDIYETMLNPNGQVSSSWGEIAPMAERILKVAPNHFYRFANQAAFIATSIDSDAPFNFFINYMETHIKNGGVGGSNTYIGKNSARREIIDDFYHAFVDHVVLPEYIRATYPDGSVPANEAIQTSANAQKLARRIFTEYTPKEIIDFAYSWNQSSSRKDFMDQLSGAPYEWHSLLRKDIQVGQYVVRELSLDTEVVLAGKALDNCLDPTRNRYYQRFNNTESRVYTLDALVGGEKMAVFELHRKSFQARKRSGRAYIHIGEREKFVLGEFETSGNSKVEVDSDIAPLFLGFSKELAQLDPNSNIFTQKIGETPASIANRLTSPKIENPADGSKIFHPSRIDLWREAYSSFSTLSLDGSQGLILNMEDLWDDIASV